QGDFVPLLPRIHSPEQQTRNGSGERQAIRLKSVHYTLAFHHNGSGFLPRRRIFIFDWPSRSPHLSAYTLPGSRNRPVSVEEINGSLWWNRKARYAPVRNAGREWIGEPAE